MTSASDRGKPQHLSPLSQQMQALREIVLDEWQRRVRAGIDGADKLAEPVLVNTFPVLYDNLAEALSPGYPRTSAEVATPSVALEHGGERARLTPFEAKSIICEYQILRSTILDVLRQHKVPVTEAESQVINSSIDASIRESVTAFALAQTALREQFFAALAHDLRGPLSSASIAAQLIARTDDLDKIHRHACKISENIARVDQMIQQLLDALVFQHGQRLRIRPTHFDLGELVREVCDELAVAHGPRLQAEGMPAHGWWGRSELRRALENLVSNALKYGASGAPVRIVYKAEHGRVLLSVHNEGKPIPPDQVETIFQVFRRAKAAKDGGTQGWGIGLPYVRAVAECHGGSIDVDSAPERGTTFTIDMPADARPFQDAPTLEG